MAVDLRALATSVKPSGRGAQSPDPKSGAGTVVCPRADAHGGRDGIIPPGIAAVRGLIPRRMREVSVAEVAKSADRLAESGRSLAEAYMAYYAEAVESPNPANPANPANQANPASAPKASQPSIAAGGGQRHEKVTEKEAGHEGTDRTDRTDRTSCTYVETDRMFSSTDRGYEDDDTLDGFYDSLAYVETGNGSFPGTKNELRTTPENGEKTRAGAGIVGYAGTGVQVRQVKYAEYSAASGAASVRDPVAEARLAGLREELAESRAQVARLTDELRSERSSLYSAREELSRLGSRQSLGEGETVRVVLSRPEERLKLGGRGWESKVMGALHFGRERRDLVVTVSDAAYAAELLASIRAGEVAVLSRGHRATCQYNGSCGKLYGDGDSQDYVACFRMSVSSIAEE